MKKIRKKLLIGILCGCLLLPVAAMADSITPDSYSATIDVGESVTINKTVTINEVTSAKVDIFFLTDSTGSMGGLINSAKTSASAILSDTSSLGDVAFGIGEYRDITDAFTYRTNTDITTDSAAAYAGINEWAAGGGGDWEEANLYALNEVATTATWREDSTRILVWFGDAPGHDPREGVSEVDAIAALNAENITVEALNTNDLDYSGQATRITDATGGTYFASIDTDAIVDAISDAIDDVFLEYGEVSLGLSGVPAGVDVAVIPGSYAGDYDRSEERTFDFDVTFTGVTAGTYDFPIYAMVDGGIVAVESDFITVGDGGPAPVPGGPAPVPEPATMLLLGVGLLGLVGFRKKFKK